MRRRLIAVAALLFAVTCAGVLWALGDHGLAATLRRITSMFVDDEGRLTGAADLLALPAFLMLATLWRLAPRDDGGAGAGGEAGAPARPTAPVSPTARAAGLLLPPSPVAVLLAVGAGVRVA
ncbi:MAG TPA: hypothetical protein PLN35_00115, partial [Quisquiliibacterium sp.]|nr:hypothetical protein [Quisquiliibacterium sp.]